jgi:hypothetical protein
MPRAYNFIGKESHWEDLFDGTYCHPRFGVVRQVRDKTWQATLHEPISWHGGFKIRKRAQEHLEALAGESNGCDGCLLWLRNV